MFNTLTNAVSKIQSVLAACFGDSIPCSTSENRPEAEAAESPLLDDLEIGLLAFETKDYSAAVSALKRVHDGDPAKFATAQVWLGLTFLKLGQADSAIEPLRRTVQLHKRLGLDPLSIAEGQFSLGLAFARSGHDECALREFRGALHHQPGWGDVLFEIARVHARRNRIADSITALGEAARQDEFFLARARRDGDFATVRETREFERCAADFERAIRGGR